MSFLKSIPKAVTIIALLATPALALAHQGEDHGAATGEAAPLMGTVESFADDKLMVKGNDGKVVSVHVDDRTIYENGGAAGKAGELKAGARVVVHGEKMTDGTLHAAKVRFGKKAPKK